jgi:hypothetical protein
MMKKITNNILSFSGYGTVLRRMTTYCFVGAGVMFACYIYLVGSITFSVVERKGLEETNKHLLSDIGMHELQYLAKEKQLTKEVAYSTGLIDAPSLVFTTAKRAVAWNAGR